MASHRFHENFDQRTWTILFAFSFLCCLTVAFVILYITKKFYFDKEGKKINTSAKGFSILSLICFLTAQIMNILYTYFVKLAGEISEHTLALWGYFNSLWTFAYLFIYLLFFIRLQKTFADTTHQINTREYIIFVILISLYFTTQQFNTVAWLCYVFNIWTWDAHNKVTFPLLFVRFSVDFLLNIYILYLFCCKLHKSFAMDQSREVYDIIIKLFILTVSTLLSTQAYTIVQILLSVGQDKALKTDNYDYYLKTCILAFVFSNIDMLVSAIYVLLSFSFTESYYDACCKCMHVQCYKLCAESKNNACPKQETNQSPEMTSTFDPEFTTTPEFTSTATIPLNVRSPSSKI